MLSRTTGPEQSKFSWKLSKIVQNQVCDVKILGEKGGGGSGGATARKITFTLVYIRKIFHQELLDQKKFKFIC
jgi:hypothetical protein